MARRRPTVQRREEQTGEHDHQPAEADNNLVDAGLKAQLELAQVRLGGDVVMDRIEDLGGDALSLLAVDISASARALVRDNRSVKCASAQRSAPRHRRKVGAEPTVSGCRPYPPRSNSIVQRTLRPAGDGSIARASRACPQPQWTFARNAAFLATGGGLDRVNFDERFQGLMTDGQLAAIRVVATEFA
jgi:hypothetical protein